MHSLFEVRLWRGKSPHRIKVSKISVHQKKSNHVNPSWRSSKLHLSPSLLQRHSFLRCIRLRGFLFLTHSSWSLISFPGQSKNIWYNFMHTWAPRIPLFFSILEEINCIFSPKNYLALVFHQGIKLVFVWNHTTGHSSWDRVAILWFTNMHERYTMVGETPKRSRKQSSIRISQTKQHLTNRQKPVDKLTSELCVT